MLQSSPQQRGWKLVVALLMQRLVGQQPCVPQHTCGVHTQNTFAGCFMGNGGRKLVWRASCRMHASMPLLAALLQAPEGACSQSAEAAA
jgi:hypothetical protein